jgi:hypothetical protein
MATDLTLNVGANVKWTYKNEITDVGDTTQTSSFSYKSTLANGTGASQADKFYVVSPTIAASGTLSLDLAGSLTDLFGNTITFARIKGVYIQFASTNTASDVTVGGAASNPATLFFADATDKINIQKTGSFLISRTDATGWPVTAGTGDILKIANNDSGNAAILQIVIWGASS